MRSISNRPVDHWWNWIRVVQSPKASQLCYCSEYVGISHSPLKLPNPSKHHRVPGIAIQRIKTRSFPDHPKSIKHRRH
ncbi:hypothetical protein FJTKL_02688 [Diaporthe vaccinii]|uniref:Uncharacterized protein n=1 Tax=Diaporthe vaccinii TaxID=105482 RepID=A0ABR4DXG4_9PEZI